MVYITLHKRVTPQIPRNFEIATKWRERWESHLPKGWFGYPKRHSKLSSRPKLFQTWSKCCPAKKQCKRIGRARRIASSKFCRSRLWNLPQAKAEIVRLSPWRLHSSVCRQIDNSNVVRPVAHSDSESQICTSVKSRSTLASSASSFPLLKHTPCLTRPSPRAERKWKLPGLHSTKKSPIIDEACTFKVMFCSASWTHSRQCQVILGSVNKEPPCDETPVQVLEDDRSQISRKKKRPTPFWRPTSRDTGFTNLSCTCVVSEQIQFKTACSHGTIDWYYISRKGFGKRIQKKSKSDFR